MSKVKLKLIYDINADTFKVSGNSSDPKNLVREFLRTQVGAGPDNSEIVEKDKYQISLNLDISQDKFKVKWDCGNKSVRDGILLRFLDT